MYDKMIDRNMVSEIDNIGLAVTVILPFHYITITSKLQSSCQNIASYLSLLSLSIFGLKLSTMYCHSTNFSQDKQFMINSIYDKIIVS